MTRKVPNRRTATCADCGHQCHYDATFCKRCWLARLQLYPPPPPTHMPHAGVIRHPEDTTDQAAAVLELLRWCNEPSWRKL